MANKLELLEVVDKDDNVIGTKTLDEIHQYGLLHREIHVWFITNNEEVIFQHRPEHKDAYPDKLDVTVRGYVMPNISYEENAIRECKNKIGIDIDPKKLIFITKTISESVETLEGPKNNTMCSNYVYIYDGSIKDLKEIQHQKGHAGELEGWKMDHLPYLSEKDKERFTPLILNENTFSIFDKAKEFMKK